MHACRKGTVKLTETFHAAFWREDHFGEYIHPERGLIDTHGLSDVNWAAVALGIAVDHNLDLLWPKLIEDKGFWWGDMPTQRVSKQKWEYEEPIAAPLLHDVASMCRVWYLEALACQRMNARERRAESVRKVCRGGKIETIALGYLPLFLPLLSPFPLPLLLPGALPGTLSGFPVVSFLSCSGLSESSTPSM
jgi:hypothetical protein